MIGMGQPHAQIIWKITSVRTYGWVCRWLSCRIGDCMFQSLNAIYNCPAQFPAVQLQLFQSFACSMFVFMLAVALMPPHGCDQSNVIGRPYRRFLDRVSILPNCTGHALLDSLLDK